MCIFRYFPKYVPSASKTAVVLWYNPAARFSNKEAIITTPNSLATPESVSVDGPGIGSANLKFSGSSTSQKYNEVNNSCKQTIFAPF